MGYFLPLTPNSLAIKVLHGATFRYYRQGLLQARIASKSLPASEPLPSPPPPSVFQVAIAEEKKFTDKMSSMVLSLTGIALCVHSKNK